MKNNNLLRKNDVLLFQGDSVTESGRDKADPASLGWGFPHIINEYLRENCPDLNIHVINRGVSGDRAAELLSRWDADCLTVQPKPTVVTILVGVNDCWHRYKHRLELTPAAAYEASYRAILAKTKEQLDARIIIMEPFLIPQDTEMQYWREDLDPKIHAARRLAADFEAVYIPLDGLFAAACIRDGSDAYAPDGVHPTGLGHGLIADAWLGAVL